MMALTPLELCAEPSSLTPILRNKLLREGVRRSRMFPLGALATDRAAAWTTGLFGHP